MLSFWDLMRRNLAFLPTLFLWLNRFNCIFLCADVICSFSTMAGFFPFLIGFLFLSHKFHCPCSISHLPSMAQNIMLPVTDFVACLGVTGTGGRFLVGHCWEQKLRKVESNTLAITLKPLLFPPSIHTWEAQKKNFWGCWELSFAMAVTIDKSDMTG